MKVKSGFFFRDDLDSSAIRYPWIEIDAGNGGGTNHRTMCQSRVNITWVG